MRHPVRLITVLAYLCLSYSTSGQTIFPKISGIILSSESGPVTGATVMLMDEYGKSVVSFAISKSNGGFSMYLPQSSDSIFALRIEHIQYISWSSKIRRTEFESGQMNLKIQLTQRNLTLQEVTVKATPLPYRIHNDTTEFRAKAYRTAETRKVEDLLKNIQGFQLTDDGRIFFQGREIERMLLEGEDLTDRHYRLLSKNLNASLIDRIQVVDNYSPDRLMREVDRTGKIAINLTLDSTYRNRMSETIGVASSGRRQLMDVSTILPAAMIKWLTFTNFNQNGTPSGTQLSDDRLGENTISSEWQDKHALALLEPMQIPQPPMDLRYARDNEDASTMQVISMHNQKGQSFRMLAGLGQSRLHRSSEWESRMKSLIGSDWQLNQQTRYSMKATEGLASILFKHDRNTNRTGHFSMNINKKNHGQWYTDQTTGDILDSLSDHHQQQRLMLTSRGHETIRTGVGNLIKISYQMDIGQSDQDQILSTNRFLSLHTPVNGMNEFNQRIKVRWFSGHLDFSWLGRSKYGKWSGGLRLSTDRQQQNLSFKPAVGTVVGSSSFPPGKTEIQSQAMVLHGTWQSAGTGKFAWFTSAVMGISPFDVRDAVIRSLAGSHVYRLTAGVDYKLSGLSGMRFNVYRNRWTPSTEWFHAGPILQSDGQVRFPATELKPETMTGLNLTISRVDLPKSFTALLYASLILTDGAYRQISSRNPGISQTTYMPFDGQRSQFISGSLSKHFPALRFKSMTDVSLQRIDGDARLDDLPITNSFGRFSIHQRLISAFPNPLNVELSYVLSRQYNRLESSLTGEMNTAQWQHVGYVRLNGRFGEKGFFSMIYGHRLLSTDKSLKTIDIYGRWKVSRSLYISITGHNLTNATAIARRMVSLNATTDQQTSLVGRYLMLGAEWSF